MTDEERGSILVPLDELRMLYDSATSSVGYGSGYLDDEEVDLLRSFAVRLGLDPMSATPENFKRKYPHPFTPVVGQWHDALTGRVWYNDELTPEGAETLIHVSFQEAKKRAEAALKKQKKEDKKHNKELAKLGIVFNDPNKPSRRQDRILAEAMAPPKTDLYQPCSQCALRETEPIHHVQLREA